LIETGVGGLVVKYVFLTSPKKRAFLSTGWKKRVFDRGPREIREKAVLSFLATADVRVVREGSRLNESGSSARLFGQKVNFAFQLLRPWWRTCRAVLSRQSRLATAEATAKADLLLDRPGGGGIIPAWRKNQLMKRCGRRESNNPSIGGCMNKQRLRQAWD
jgi:hypothetical protein